MSVRLQDIESLGQFSKQISLPMMNLAQYGRTPAFIPPSKLPDPTLWHGNIVLQWVSFRVSRSAKFWRHSIHQPEEWRVLLIQFSWGFSPERRNPGGYNIVLSRIFLWSAVSHQIGGWVGRRKDFSHLFETRECSFSGSMYMRNSLTRGKGAYIVLQHPRRIASIQNEGILVKPGTETNVAVLATRIRSDH